MRNVHWVVVEGKNLDDLVATRYFYDTVTEGGKTIDESPKGKGYQGAGAKVKPDPNALDGPAQHGLAMNPFSDVFVIADAPGLYRKAGFLMKSYPLTLHANLLVTFSGRLTGDALGAIWYELDMEMKFPGDKGVNTVKEVAQEIAP